MTSGRCASAAAWVSTPQSNTLPRGCTRAASSPRHLAENVLKRRFYADRPNEKWLTDVTEFHYYGSHHAQALSQSAILDLCDRRIVSFFIRDTNDAALVHSTLDLALEAAPRRPPPAPQRPGQRLYHSDLPRQAGRVGITQSMSRVGKCIDNGPMEGFWGSSSGNGTRQTLHQPGGTGPYDPGLHRLLQFPPPPAWAGCPDAHGGSRLPAGSIMVQRVLYRT